MDGHNEQCQAALDQWKVEVEQFKLKYPYYCTACNGLGGHAWYDISTGFTDIEICPQCIGAEDTVPTCSLCGQIMTEHITGTMGLWGESINIIGFRRQCTCPYDTYLPEPPECVCCYTDYTDDYIVK